jgi:hypothetical protein
VEYEIYEAVFRVLFTSETTAHQTVNRFIACLLLNKEQQQTQCVCSEKAFKSEVPRHTACLPATVLLVPPVLLAFLRYIASTDVLVSVTDM